MYSVASEPVLMFQLNLIYRKGAYLSIWMKNWRLPCKWVQSNPIRRPRGPLVICVFEPTSDFSTDRARKEARRKHFVFAINFDKESEEPTTQLMSHVKPPREEAQPLVRKMSTFLSASGR